MTKVGHSRKHVLEGHAPFCFMFFLQKIFARLTSLFFTFICIWNRVRSVFSDGWSRDRDIFRDRTYLVFCFRGWVVKFRGSEANCWRRRSENREFEFWQWCFFSFFLFFSFFSSWFNHFFSTKRTNSPNKGGSKRGEKAERRQIAVRFTRFVDYRLMFDSGRSFSLENDLIRSPYKLEIRNP